MGILMPTGPFSTDSPQIDPFLPFWTHFWPVSPFPQGQFLSQNPRIEYAIPDGDTRFQWRARKPVSDPFFALWSEFSTLNWKFPNLRISLLHTKLEAAQISQLPALFEY